jgi:hypothetical protein
MILLNFSHPITKTQRDQIEKLSGTSITREVNVPAQFDHQQNFDTQLANLMSKVSLSAAEWQTAPILLNLPSLNFIAALLLAELHGRMGYFPPCIRLRPIKDALPPRFEVAELLNLNVIRENARKTRH